MDLFGPGTGGPAIPPPPMDLFGPGSGGPAIPPPPMDLFGPGTGGPGIPPPPADLFGPSAGPGGIPPPPMDLFGPGPGAAGGIPPPPADLFGGGPPPPPADLFGAPPPPPGDLFGAPPPPGDLFGFSAPAAAPAPKPKAKLPYTKKSVAPGTKMRALHWTKVDDFEVEKTVWNDLSDQKVPLDASEFESLFCLSKPKTAGAEDEGKDSAAPGKDDRRASTVGGGAPSVVTLVDGQRGQNVAIAIARFRPLTHEALRDAILSMDEKALPVEKVTTLLKCIPTPEEIEMVQGYDGPPEQLGNPERFFLAMAQIPRLQRRLELFLFKQTFAAQLEEARGKVQLCLRTLTTLRESKALRKTLEYVLALGNYLNGGGAKGGAYGFKVAFLPKLAATKTVDNKSNLLQFLVQLLERDTASKPLQTLLDELTDLPAASRVEAAVLASEVARVGNTMTRASTDVKAAKPSDSDRFAAVMGAFVAEYAPQAEALAAEHARVATEADAVAAMFGEDPKTFPMDAAFALFNEFITQLRQAQQQLAKEVAEKERQERIKAAAEARAKAGGPGAAAAGAAAGAGGAAGAAPNMGALAAAAAMGVAGLKSRKPADDANAGDANAAAGAGAGAAAAASGPVVTIEGASPSGLKSRGSSTAAAAATGAGDDAAAGASGAAAGAAAGAPADGLGRKVGATLRGGNSADILKEINARRAARSANQDTRRMFDAARGSVLVVPGVGGLSGAPPPPSARGSTAAGGFPRAPPPAARASVVPSAAPAPNMPPPAARPH